MTQPSNRITGVVLAHPSGNEFFRHLALALNDAGRLASVCTCLDWPLGGVIDQLLPKGLKGELRRRSFSRALARRVEQHPWREFVRLAAGRLGLPWLSRHETGFFSVDAVYRDFDRWVAKRLKRISGAGIVYAYEDAAEATFGEAIRLGWRRVYDLPIAYWETSQRLLREEAMRLPAWEPTLGGTRDSPAKLARKTRELEMADIVVCPSRFVTESLPGWAREGKRVVLAPFGCPGPVALRGLVRRSLGEDGSAGEDRSRSLASAEPRGDGLRSGLRVLFAGSMTQRKGLGDLFAAMKLLGRSDVELVVMGTPVAGMEFYRREYSGFTHEPPRPHGEVLALMRTCDVFCLPSIVEGRALVIQEAMSRGLPAIVTPNSGADDAVEEGRNGFVVPIRSPVAIAEKVAWCADHRDLLPDMGRRARDSAARITWESYGAAILAAI